MWSYLTLAHLIGLAFGVGAATVKLILLFKCRSDRSFIPVYIKVVKPITKFIIAGMILLTLSGIGWLLYDYPLTEELIVKLIFVAALWITGPYIDKVAEPKFIKLASEQANSTKLIASQQKYIIAEVIATGLFYLIIVYWVFS
jgi:hypothetical protein